MARIDPLRRIPPQRLQRLEQQMQAYYASVSDYPAFHAPSEHPLEWRHVRDEVCRRHVTSREPVTILEFGSGRSGFPSWLRQQLDSSSNTHVAITCQDVTATNQAYLQQVADQVLLAPLEAGLLPPACLDIIFSTHVLEHVAQPEALLHTCIRLLKPGGALLLFAPRYELPFYLSPSSLNLAAAPRLLLAIRLLLIRWLAQLRGRPAFVMDTAPACLDRPFVRDADAIHWVSQQDIELFALRNGLEVTHLDVRHQVPLASKQWLIDRFGKLAVALHKPLRLRTH